ncbi:MAG: flagellar motor protein MotB [Treponema sp.]|jgi:chemotaxis protein MotB|nr:flagellar motor protein MotB [Treponema sp.]
MAKKEKKEPEKPSQEWLATYGDMITLMLCFFVMLYNPSDSDPVQMATLIASIQGNASGGGVSLSMGSFADMGNNVNVLPSMERGRALGQVYRKAVSLFVPDVRSNRISVTSDERAVVISLVGDNFFASGSAELNIDTTRETLLRLAQFLSSPDAAKRRFRVEGHTDNTPAEVARWPNNWELSAARAINVLRYLSDYGVDEKQFSVAGYADTRPKFSNETAEGRAYNRRVDIVILDEGHF